MAIEKELHNRVKAAVLEAAELLGGKAEDIAAEAVNTPMTEVSVWVRLCNGETPTMDITTTYQLTGKEKEEHPNV